MSEKSPFSNLDHIGVIVRDMDKAIKYYESLGIGPFKALGSAERVDQKMLGKPFDVTTHLTARMGKVGATKIELIQPFEGESLWREFLDTKGEGIMHLCFYVDDIDKAEAEMVDKGFEVIFHLRYKVDGKVSGGGAYIDTRKFGGFITELVQWAPGMITV
ncbi:VOC family protein [Chloroflexota bacterium]